MHSSNSSLETNKYEVLLTDAVMNDYFSNTIGNRGFFGGRNYFRWFFPAVENRVLPKIRVIFCGLINESPKP
jgi:hypothetical protein